MRSSKPTLVSIAVLLAALCVQPAPGRTATPAPVGPIAARPAPQQLALAEAPAPPESRFDAIAGFIAGLPTGSPTLAAHQDNAAWKAYRDYIDSRWTTLDSGRLAPMREWVSTHLAEADRNTRYLFYPFGGPDILTALQLFPQVGTCVLVGLEPVGNLPEAQNWKPEYMESYLEDVEQSLTDFFKRGYFITRDMNLNLESDKMDGVLPLICLFLERSRAGITDIRRIEFDKSGAATETPYAPLARRPHRPYGVRVAYHLPATGRSGNVFYFSADLSDPEFNQESSFYRYLGGVADMTVLIKSASYLLHYNNFSNVRNLILDKSRYIFQDDTGIPYKFFGKDRWEVKLYGRYAEPVKDFSGVGQPDLKAAYLADDKIERLPFDYGYHWRERTDAVMYIRRLP